MSLTFAFDVYGTLINTHGLVTELEKTVGDHAKAFSQMWRDKQLEYSFRKGLMDRYEQFSVCTQQALDYTCQFFQVEMSDIQKNALLISYGKLPVFEDVKLGLENLSDHHLFAFSNGAAGAVDNLLGNAGIRQAFQDIISVDEIQTFKPNPETYAHFLKRTNAKADRTWLISSNPFDVIGAKSAGFNTAWVQRDAKAIFDPWGVEPDLIVASLPELAERIN
ncbi:haloacid dehalogenase type II [Neptuniibacter caesariensis]|uniref:(S)-2-haloacid dehalogenase n=1 Tax=Neptuniibacter caesariensis TaxID=207954 RepID=A0A7U8C6E2_NEPCE|nr:haloacid dehalogenase type II [Neptuniibacter caesariensis]EAR60935.1 L-2-haloalkanoic acid dehalogenase, HAD superfamily protein [Oceanospirillum sp. MED92] [Neptuniibacter caesariensis]